MARKYVGTTMTYHHPDPLRTSEKELAAHTGQRCKVIRREGPPEVDVEVGYMYKVCFNDGFESTVFLDELTP